MPGRAGNRQTLAISGESDIMVDIHPFETAVLRSEFESNDVRIVDRDGQIWLPCDAMVARNRRCFHMMESEFHERSRGCREK